MSIDTIIAPASAIGGGVAVIRVSGPQAFPFLHALSGKKNFQNRMAELVTLRHPHSQKLLDKALILTFENPYSFTGEDVVELHVHGGRAVVQNVLQSAFDFHNSIRLAEGGEFTKRAYLNGKMDLTEAEAIADLVAAETDAQLELAQSQMGGALRDLYETWRTKLVKILAYLEATIDFVDEEDVPANLFAETAQKIAPLVDELQNHLQDGHLGERLRDGFVVAIIGAPNAGKSSLINALVKRDVAIVSNIAGTTRDALEAHLNLGGYPVILIDTAGLRETTDTIEAEGIARAKQRAAKADLVLALFDATQERDQETITQLDARTLIVQTKADLVSDVPQDVLSVSTQTGSNLDRLQKIIQDKIAALTARPKNAQPLLTRTRHREAVAEALQHLQRAVLNNDVALLAEDVRLATRALGRLTGRVDVEDLLDVIFRDFCIGK